MKKKGGEKQEVGMNHEGGGEIGGRTVGNGQKWGGRGWRGGVGWGGGIVCWRCSVWKVMWRLSSAGWWEGGLAGGGGL